MGRSGNDGSWPLIKRRAARPMEQKAESAAALTATPMPSQISALRRWLVFVALLRLLSGKRVRPPCYVPACMCVRTRSCCQHTCCILLFPVYLGYFNYERLQTYLFDKSPKSGALCCCEDPCTDGVRSCQGARQTSERSGGFVQSRNCTAAPLRRGRPCHACCACYAPRIRLIKRSMVSRCNLSSL